MVRLTDHLDMNIGGQIKRTNKATQISTMSIIWAMSTENQTLLQAYTKDADQPVHSRSLFSAFVIDPLKNNNYSYIMQNFNLLASLCS